MLSIAKYLLGLVFVCHLFACVWGLQASFNPLGTWPSQKGYCVAWPDGGAFAGIDGDDACPADRVCNSRGYACAPPMTMYLYAIYWSIATVSSNASHRA